MRRTAYYQDFRSDRSLFLNMYGSLVFATIGFYIIGFLAACFGNSTTYADPFREIIKEDARKRAVITSLPTLGCWTSIYPSMLISSWFFLLEIPFLILLIIFIIKTVSYSKKYSNEPRGK